MSGFFVFGSGILVGLCFSLVVIRPTVKPERVIATVQTDIMAEPGLSILARKSSRMKQLRKRWR